MGCGYGVSERGYGEDFGDDGSRERSVSGVDHVRCVERWLTRLIAPMTVIVVLALLAGGEVGAQPSATGTVAPGTNRVARLGWDLVRAAGEKNVIVSPMSVWETLAMLHAGARGTTASEIAGVLGMPDDSEVTATAAESMKARLGEAKGSNTALDFANRLWVQQGLTVKTQFATLLAKRYGAAVGSVDFTDSHFNRARLSVGESVGRGKRRFAVATGCSAR